MHKSTDRDYDFADTPSSKALLRVQDQISEEWIRRIRAEVPATREVAYPVLINTFPKFLVNLAEALSTRHPRKAATEFTNIPEEHGGERARLTKYTPAELIMEYQILRDVIIELLSREVNLTYQDLNVIHFSLDEALKEAMGYFFQVHSRLKEQIVATITHDMRNPLSATKLSLELILRTIQRGDSEATLEKIYQLSERALKNTKRVDRMIQDILDTTVLVEQGKRIPIQISHSSLSELLHDVVADMDESERERIQVMGSDISVYWDTDAIRRALENLIRNAIKYGDRTREITISYESGHERVEVSVHNFGKAIPENEQSSLFDPFHRTRSAQASGRKGWGIGLAVTKSITLAHGGSLLLDSTEGTGTTFTLDLPVDARPVLEATG